MTMNKEETVSILNDLIEISIDGEEGFLLSAESVDDAVLKNYFSARAQEVKESVAELQSLVRDLGCKPTQSSSVSGYLHRRWIDLISAVKGNDTFTILNEVERGEDVALAAYKEAAAKDLSHEVRLTVMRQLMGAQHNHDQVKQLRNFVAIEAH